MTTSIKLDPNPISQFSIWYEMAVQAGAKKPEIMALATATPRGGPSVRMMVYKGLNEKGFQFFTHYQSRKACEINSNPRAACVFHWAELNKGVRIEGLMETLPESESDHHWLTLPRESRINIMASTQSAVIPTTEELTQRIQELTRLHQGKEISRPSNWGGYCLVPQRIEFWSAGNFMLHSRSCYMRKDGRWEIYPLSP